MALTVFILASRSDERYINRFWVHLALCRRTMPGVIWATPCYVEDLAEAQALIPVQQGPYIVIGCLSAVFLSTLFEQPAIREMIERARLKVPLVVSRCEWDRPPSPFAGKMPFSRQELATSNHDHLLVDVAAQLRKILVSEAWS